MDKPHGNSPTAADLARVEQKVDALSGQIADLIEAWKTAQGIVRFVKWLSTVAVAVTSIWAVFKFGQLPK